VERGQIIVWHATRRVGNAIVSRYRPRFTSSADIAVQQNMIAPNARKVKMICISIIATTFSSVKSAMNITGRQNRNINNSK
jgi:hypothetical protein